MRSVKAKNRPSSVRPDSVNLYVQLDVFADHLISEKGVWTTQVAPCTPNVALLTEKGEDVKLKVANPFKIIHDVVICKVNNEDDDDYQSLEDGRSRRYFLTTCVFAHMVSVPIEESFLPITFTKHHCTRYTGNFRINQLRFYADRNSYVEVMVSCIGGKNLSDYSLVSVDAYTSDLRNFMALANRSVVELASWAKRGTIPRKFIVLLMKDHCAPLEAHDPRRFQAENARKWHIPSLEASAIEASATAGWWDIFGWHSDIPDISVVPVMYDWDDHVPCMFDIHFPYQEIGIGPARERAREYYIDRPWRETVTVRKHDGTKVPIFE